MLAISPIRQTDRQTVAPSLMFMTMTKPCPGANARASRACDVLRRSFPILGSSLLHGTWLDLHPTTNCFDGLDTASPHHLSWTNLILLV